MVRVPIFRFFSWPHSQALFTIRLCLLVVMVLIASGCKSNYPAVAKQTHTNGEKGIPKRVKAVAVRAMPLERTVTVLGALAAYDQATLSTKVPGRLYRLTVDFGSGVEQGQTIAQIEPRDYQLRLQQAEAALAQARVRLGLSPKGS